MTETTQSEYLRIPAGGADASLLGVLGANLYSDIVAEFEVDGKIQCKAGMLYAVGADYIALYDDVHSTSIIASLPALRFATFYPSGAQPAADDGPQTANNTNTPQSEARANEYVAVPTGTRAHAQAAFNYAKRKTRKLE